MAELLTPTPGRPSHARHIRVIPTLLMDKDGRLVKTVRFGKRTYIGDPINAVKILNTKEVDELVLIDIDATRTGREPAYSLIADIVGEAFMPVTYGGGLHKMSHIEQVYQTGIEKVMLSSCLAEGTALITSAAARWGSQAITVCLPTSKSWLGRSRVRIRAGRQALAQTPEAVARMVTQAGAGELVIYAIDRDGTFAGYDLDLLRRVCAATNVPVVACGGAQGVQDFANAVVNAGCSAVAAGSLFVYQSQGKGVLINYPAKKSLEENLYRFTNRLG